MLVMLCDDLNSAKLALAELDQVRQELESLRSQHAALVGQRAELSWQLQKCLHRSREEQASLRSRIAQLGLECDEIRAKGDQVVAVWSSLGGDDAFRRAMARAERAEVALLSFQHHGLVVPLA